MNLSAAADSCSQLLVLHFFMPEKLFLDDSLLYRLLLLYHLLSKYDCRQRLQKMLCWLVETYCQRLQLQLERQWQMVQYLWKIWLQKIITLTVMLILAYMKYVIVDIPCSFCSLGSFWCRSEQKIDICIQSDYRVWALESQHKRNSAPHSGFHRHQLFFFFDALTALVG